MRFVLMEISPQMEQMIIILRVQVSMGNAGIEKKQSSGAAGIDTVVAKIVAGAGNNKKEFPLRVGTAAVISRKMPGTGRRNPAEDFFHTASHYPGNFNIFHNRNTDVFFVRLMYLQIARFVI